MRATYETLVYPELDKVRQAVRRLMNLREGEIADILNALADLSEEEAPFLLKANQEDLDRMAKDDPKYDRLLLTASRIAAIATDLRKVASLPSPLGNLLEERKVESGLILKRISVPLGVVGIIFESRPNVTFDVFSLCLKSGNGVVLKGSRDAHSSNLAILQLIKTVLAPYGIEDCCYLAPSEREALPAILQADEYIDVIIPRGSQGLIRFVRENARVPVIETGAGIVHTYLDKTADITKAKGIVTNAKARRVSVCNALDCLLIHEEIAEQLPFVVSDLGSLYECKILADEQAYTLLTGTYPKELLFAANADSFGTEFLSMQLAIKVVSDIEEALDHIAKYSSKHSEAIVGEDEATCDYFLKQVDAAVVYANTTTAFTDGAQFGMGAEIGISTQKLHARGPMALQELTSYKWIVKGSGQIRE
jgi:glutamate-5-semialdehyde dehydrogenase